MLLCFLTLDHRLLTLVGGHCVFGERLKLLVLPQVQSVKYVAGGVLVLCHPPSYIEIVNIQSDVLCSTLI